MERVDALALGIEGVHEMHLGLVGGIEMREVCCFWNRAIVGRTQLVRNRNGELDGRGRIEMLVIIF